MSFDFAKLVICGDGSEPMDKIQINGVVGSDSVHVASKSKMHASPYTGPRESTLQFTEIQHSQSVSK